MALFTADLRNELSQIKEATDDIVKNQLSPLISDAISQAGKELGDVVEHASTQIQANIQSVSEEIHNQRKLTKDDIKELIDYAAEQVGNTLESSLEKTKREFETTISHNVNRITVSVFGLVAFILLGVAGIVWLSKIL